MTRVSTTLRAAAKRLRKVGWRSEQYGGFRGPNCLAGALEWGTDSRAPALVAVLAGDKARWFLQEELLGGMILEDFNDTEIGSTAEAVAFLELGAELAEAEGL